MLEFQSFDMAMEQDVEDPAIGIPANLRDVHISYDGGRLEVSMNGVTVLDTAFAGNSFYIGIDKK